MTLGRAIIGAIVVAVLLFLVAAFVSVTLAKWIVIAVVVAVLIWALLAVFGRV